MVGNHRASASMKEKVYSTNQHSDPLECSLSNIIVSRDFDLHDSKNTIFFEKD